MKKQKMTKYILTLFFAAIIWSCNYKDEIKPVQKYKTVTTKYTEIKEIISKEVDDTFYVYVRLPKNYDQSNEKYPVLYLLDGDISFNMATSIVRYLQYGNDVPEMIIIGIGYGTMMNDNEQNFRERDYSISKVERFHESGGADKYLNFIEKELIPTVEKNYRTSNLRILNGYSLGGLFTLNTLIDKPELFNYYIDGSPYLSNDISELDEKASQINKFEKKKKLFISVGETEDQIEYHNPIKRIEEKLDKIENLSLKFVEFENGTHFTCPTEALTYGLRFVFSIMEQ